MIFFFNKNSKQTQLTDSALSEFFFSFLQFFCLVDDLCWHPVENIANFSFFDTIVICNEMKIWPPT